MKAKFRMSTGWWYRKISESSCLKHKKQPIKENMVQTIKCNYYFSCARKLSNSAFSLLGEFIQFLIVTFFLLLSPSFQYCSVCISVSRETVRWKAKTSSSPVNMESPLAESYINVQKQHNRTERDIAVQSTPYLTPKFIGIDNARQQHDTKKTKKPHQKLK